MDIDFLLKGGGTMPKTRIRTSGKDKKKPFLRLRGVLFALFLVAICIYPFAKIRWAHSRVQAFSNVVSIGMPADPAGLEAKAKDLGLKTLASKGIKDEPTRLLVWQGWAFARWFCEVEFIQNKVSKKEVYFLD
jgi:hypothetical protein